MLVVAILGFIILPAVVVGIAAFNDKALLVIPAAAIVAALVLQRASTTAISRPAFATG